MDKLNKITLLTMQKMFFLNAVALLASYPHVEKNILAVSKSLPYARLGQVKNLPQRLVVVPNAVLVLLVGRYLER